MSAFNTKTFQIFLRKSLEPISSKSILTSIPSSAFFLVRKVSAFQDHHYERYNTEYVYSLEHDVYLELNHQILLTIRINRQIIIRS